MSPRDADAQIGTVKVGGDWIASSLIAGIDRTNGRVGAGNDTKLTASMSGGKDEALAFSKIARITIGGHVLGTGDPSETFGFGAEEIGSFKVNGVALGLLPGRHNDNFATAPSTVGSALPVVPPWSMSPP